MQVMYGGSNITFQLYPQYGFLQMNYFWWKRRWSAKFPDFTVYWTHFRKGASNTYFDTLSSIVFTIWDAHHLYKKFYHLCSIAGISTLQHLEIISNAWLRLPRTSSHPHNLMTLYNPSNIRHLSQIRLNYILYSNSETNFVPYCDLPSFNFPRILRVNLRPLS